MRKTSVNERGIQIVKKIKILLITSVFVSFLLPFNIQAQDNVLNFTDVQIPRGVLKQISNGKKTEIPGSRSSGKNWGNSINVVTLSGKTNHFGMDISVSPPEFLDYHATVPDVKVRISEFPFTKNLDLQPVSYV